MKVLERERVELHSLGNSTGDGKHIQVLKRKTSPLSDLLGLFAVICRVYLIRSRFQNVSQMDASPLLLWTGM